MVSQRLINKLTFRILATVTAILVIFNEFLIYNINKNYWSKIECETENCTRILLVADPQILGETSDKMAFSTIAMVDSDRFLQKTFQRAVEFSNPNVICYLGDLLDEGSIASEEQYKSYVQRFKNIFSVNNNIKEAHVSGDNDIGGENGEYISNSNVRRFEIEFENNDIFEYKKTMKTLSVRFFKINRMLLDYKNPDSETNLNSLRIGLSHLPLLISGTTFLRNFINDIDPHVIFSAHWHESRIFTYPSQDKLSHELLDSRIVIFDLLNLKYNNQFLEIMVPTSSYRMGTHKIGYGLAVLDNYTLRYTVLWTFSRFTFLYLYLGWLIILIFLIITLQICLRCTRKITKQYKNAYERILFITNN